MSIFFISFWILHEVAPAWWRVLSAVVIPDKSQSKEPGASLASACAHGLCVCIPSLWCQKKHQGQLEYRADCSRARLLVHLFLSLWWSLPFPGCAVWRQWRQRGLRLQAGGLDRMSFWQGSALDHHWVAAPLCHNAFSLAFVTDICETDLPLLASPLTRM